MCEISDLLPWECTAVVLYVATRRNTIIEVEEVTLLADRPKFVFQLEEKLIKFHPSYLRINYVLKLVFWRTGNYKTAFETWEQLVRLHFEPIEAELY